MQKHERVSIEAVRDEARKHGVHVEAPTHGGKAHMRITLSLGNDRETLTFSSSPRSGCECARNFARQKARAACRLLMSRRG